MMSLQEKYIKILRRIKRTLIVVFGVMAVLGVVLFCFEYSIAAKPYKGPATDHFDGERFWNIGEREGLVVRGEKQEGDEEFGVRTMFSRDKKTWQEKVLQEVKVATSSRELVVTHINHATVLIQVAGKNIITDPVYSERVSPLFFVGPRRYSNPRIPFKNLPKIDMVLVTHNHYDHMDLETLRMLQQRDDPIVVMTLGNKAYLEQRGITQAVETDWYDVTTYFDRAITLTTVPAQHFSARGLRDRNKTLWAGFVIKAEGVSIYVSGDTGYGPFIEKIKSMFPEGFDYGVLPIGAYKPRWFMKMVHTNPEEALQMMKDLSIKKAIGIHFGTFPLANDAQLDPVYEIISLRKEERFKSLEFEVQGW